MRWQALIVLVAVMAGILAPPSLPLLTASGAHASIGELDVCHQAVPALSSNGDMPFQNESSVLPAPLTAVLVPEAPPTMFKPFLLSLQDERPPQA